MVVQHGKWEWGAGGRTGLFAWEAMQYARQWIESSGLYRKPVRFTFTGLSVHRTEYIYMYSHDRIGSVLIETDSITFLATCPPQAWWPTFQPALLSCKCLGPSHTRITYHCKTPSPESIYLSLSEVHLFVKLYSMPWRSTDSDFLGMEMRKGFQTGGPSTWRCSLQHPDV